MSSDTDSLSFSLLLNFLSKETSTVSFFSIYPTVIYAATVIVTAVFRFCPFNATDSSAFFASSLRNRTDLTLPFRVIVYSTPGLISIVTVPASAFPSITGVITPAHSTRIRHAANAAIHLNLTLLRLTPTFGCASEINRSSICPIALNNFSFFINEYPPFRDFF